MSSSGRTTCVVVAEWPLDKGSLKSFNTFTITRFAWLGQRKPNWFQHLHGPNGWDGPITLPHRWSATAVMLDATLFLTEDSIALAQFCSFKLITAH